MENLTRGIRVLHHSAIRIESCGKVLYFDPFGIEDAFHDADYVFITHDHYDHFSPEDIRSVSRPDTVLIAPQSMVEKTSVTGLSVLVTQIGRRAELPGITYRAISAYNPAKPFHPQANGWVGYVVTLGGLSYYVAGDTDRTPENECIRCDVALLPIGGTYTMDAAEAAELALEIRPQVVIPTHYGAVTGKAADAETLLRLLDGKIPCRILMERL